MPVLGERTKAAAPEGVTAPVQYGPWAAALGTCLWHGRFLSRTSLAANPPNAGTAGMCA